MRKLSFLWRVGTRNWIHVTTALFLTYTTLIACFLPGGSIGLPHPHHPHGRKLHHLHDHGWSHAHDDDIDLHVLGPPPHPHAPVPILVHSPPPHDHLLEDPHRVDPEDPSVLYQLEYSHSGSPPPSHGSMMAHGPIQRPGPSPTHHGSSLPKLQFIHFMNPLPLRDKKYSYAHNLRRNKHIGLAPRPYPLGAHRPGLVTWINRLVLRMYCAFNGMNAQCLHYYGEHEGWLGGEPYHQNFLT